MRWLLIALVATILGLGVKSAHAHDFTPGVLALDERGPGELAMQWTPPVDSRTRHVVDVTFPPGCTATEKALACPGGLRGDIVFHGMRAEMQVLVVLQTLDGTSTEHLVSGRAGRITIGGPVGSAASTWLVLGVEHILGGLDHLAFVLALLLLVEGRRRLFFAITAFTVAHSITLGLAAFDVIRLPSAPVEATIAASVLCVAREAMSDRETLSKRAPWLVALIFGLVHGLGFAGVLRDLGLPEGSAGKALFFFNVGVEIGQLAIVVVVLGVAHLARRWVARAPRLRTAACYALGAVAAFWLVDRTVLLLTG